MFSSRASEARKRQTLRIADCYACTVESISKRSMERVPTKLLAPRKLYRYIQLSDEALDVPVEHAKPNERMGLTLSRGGTREALMCLRCFASDARDGTPRARLDRGNHNGG